jgi:hypothetical protein
MTSKMKVDFYQITMPDGAPTFEQLLRKIDSYEGQKRAYDLARDVSAWLLELDDRNGKLEGNFVRGRRDYLPKKGKRGEETKALKLDDDDEVTDESAFIFDSASNVIALQRNRSGLSRKGIQAYLAGHRSITESILFAPLVKEEAIKKLANMSVTKKLVMRIAKPEDARRYVNEGKSTNEAIGILNRLNAPSLRIEASVGRTDGKLAQTMAFVKELLSLGEKDEIDVHTMQVSGEIDDEPTFVDLIEDKISIEVSVEPSDRRTLPYVNRRISLRQAWKTVLPELKNYGVVN